VTACEPLWIGLDLGTQSARAMAVTASGLVAGSGSRPLRSRRDGARHEQAPGDWWEALAGGRAADAGADVRRRTGDGAGATGS
jgi:sugar (pentulose or hexulose) kinase